MGNKNRVANQLAQSAAAAASTTEGDGFAATNDTKSEDDAGASEDTSAQDGQSASQDSEQTGGAASNEGEDPSSQDETLSDDAPGVKADTSTEDTSGGAATTVQRGADGGLIVTSDEAASQSTAAAPQQAPSQNDLGVADTASSRVSAEADAVDTTQAKVIDTQPAAAVSEFEQTIGPLRNNGTVEETTLIAKLEAYLAAMAPGLPIAEKDGVARQYELFTILRNVIDYSPNEQFTRLWSIVILFFKEHGKGSFGPRYVGRFSEHWARPQVELFALQQIVNLLIASAKDLNTATTFVKPEIAVSKGFTELGRGRILNYYQR